MIRHNRLFCTGRIFLVCLFVQASGLFAAPDATPVETSENKNAASEKAPAHLLGNEIDESSLPLLLSTRLEIIEYANILNPVREHTSQFHRLYFNNIYINLEGDIHSNINFIVEFQALTSELYLLGGFVTVADSLEGIGNPDKSDLTVRAKKISKNINKHIKSIDSASQRPNFERALINFDLYNIFGIKLGKVRNPFGFWDDYSLFRNLSLGKTDPISLGVPLRRTDLGLLFYGQLLGKYLTYNVGVLDGENIFKNEDSNKHKDLVLNLGTSFHRFDLGINGYTHNTGASSGTPYAVGFYLRYRMTNNLTLLGEVNYIKNERLDISTNSVYLQINYDLSGMVAEGLRWNSFLESYHSGLLEIDLEPDLDYVFAGTISQVSTGFLYALNRNLDLGMQFITGADEEGEEIAKVAFKVDAKF